MDFRQNNRSAQAARPANATEVRPLQPAGNTQSPIMTSPGRGKKVWAGVGIAVIAILLILAGAAWWLMSAKDSPDAGAAAIKKDAYQAVFLTNGQVYFGKLQSTKGDYITIKDIYYLQVQEPVQPAEKKEAADANNNVQLIKLGNELHGPEDQMQISNQQVLFWENLKPDSKVTQAISQYNP